MTLLCQAGSKAHDIRLEYLPRTVWSKSDLGISAINVSKDIMVAFQDVAVVSPIVKFEPIGTMFRQPMK